MRCPKSIKALLEKRARTAERYTEYDYAISAWLDKHGIEAEPYDTHGGVEAIVNPWDSSRRILEAIERTDNPHGDQNTSSNRKD